MSGGCPYSDDGEGCPMVEEANQRADAAEEKLRGCFRLPEGYSASGVAIELRAHAEALPEQQVYRRKLYPLLADAIEHGAEGGEGVWVTREQATFLNERRGTFHPPQWLEAWDAAGFKREWLEPEKKDERKGVTQA